MRGYLPGHMFILPVDQLDVGVRPFTAGAPSSQTRKSFGTVDPNHTEGCHSAKGLELFGEEVIGFHLKGDLSVQVD